MSYNRPGKGTHLVNSTGVAIAHNSPTVINGIAGIAIKQKNAGWAAGLTKDGAGLYPANRIEIGEKFWCITKGIVQVSSTPLTTPVKGDPVYITPAGALTKTVGTNQKFGRIVELPGDGRSVPTGLCRIDMDLKDSF